MSKKHSEMGPANCLHTAETIRSLGKASAKRTMCRKVFSSKPRPNLRCNLPNGETIRAPILRAHFPRDILPDALANTPVEQGERQ